MKNIKLYFLLAFVSIFALSCETADVDPENTNYVTFADSGFSASVDPGANATVTVPVYTANITGSDRTFNLSVDGSGAPAGSFTAPATVTVPGGTNEGSIDITLNDPQNIAVNTVVISLVGEEGLSVGGATTISFVQSCNEITATLDIVFDGYGSETSWAVYDELGGVVVSKAQGSYTDGQASASESFALCQGRVYTFEIYDSYGDGLSFPANGTYTLTVGGSVKASGGGDFGSGESTGFNTN